MPGPSAPPPFPEMHEGFGDQVRARFRDTLVAPSPFQNFNHPESTTATTSTPTSTPGSGPPSDPIDPHLNGVVIAAAVDARQKVTVDADAA